MIYTDEFPNCCTGTVAFNFGETDVNGCGNHDVKELGLKQQLINILDENKEDGYAFVICTTNSQQPTANKLLKSMGFSHSTWMSKDEHPETKVRIWWMPLEKWEGS